MLESTGSFITETECADLGRLLGQKHGGAMGERYFEVAVKQDGFGVYATVTLRNRTGSYVYPVEGRVSHRDHDLTPREACLLLLDLIDVYFGEYFAEGGDTYLPIDWAEYTSDGVPMQLRGQIRNEELEAAADAFLAGQGLH